MRRLAYFIAVALPFGVGSAMAADLPTSAPPPAPYVAAPPTFTWTGFYIGLNGGYAGDQFRYPFSIGPAAGPPAITGSASLDSSGFLGGGQIGYNYQFGRFVAGLEADIDGSSVEGKLKANINDPPISATLSAGSNIDYFGTVRGRLGYAVLDRALLYVTGGLAYSGIKSAYNISEDPIGTLASGSETHSGIGWTAGAGLEYALTNNWTFKTEYLYADLGRHTSASFAGGGISASLSTETRLNIVRAGLNYKF